MMVEPRDTGGKAGAVVSATIGLEVGFAHPSRAEQAGRLKRRAEHTTCGSAAGIPPVIFFPLAIVVAVVMAFRGLLAWAVTAGVALFAFAVLTAWQVQGFRPSPRDLAWLLLVLLATWGSSRIGERARRGPGATPGQPQ